MKIEERNGLRRYGKGFQILSLKHVIDFACTSHFHPQSSHLFTKEGMSGEVILGF